MLSNRVLLLIVLALLSLASASAAVVDSAANGFTVKITVDLKAPPNDVYRAFVRVADWWESGHTFSGDARNMTIDDKPMGCFCEKLPNGGGVRHMEVVFAAPGQRLILTGALGPLQSLGVVGNMEIEFARAEGGSKLTLTYSVGGYIPAGLNTWAEPVNGMLSQQMARLKAAIEKPR